jgi:D-alanyl-lipoteichoic acid acyltransferase DltB (MBOAT superfamily)
MLFNSYEFLLIFLPLVLLAYHGLLATRTPGSALSLLVASSLFFYGWWNPHYLVLILASIAVNYACYLGIRRLSQPRGKLLLTLGIVFNLGLLGYFKYAGFFAGNVGELLGLDMPALAIVLPLAISFFTFQQIAFLVDAHRGLVGETGLREYMLFVLFFPQLIAGPIVHHAEMMPQFTADRVRDQRAHRFASGLTLFTLGMVKKVLVADSLAPFVAEVYDATDGQVFTAPDIWLASLAYTLQLYFDFSGYSDMAIGLALMFGIQLPLNFNSPYKARSIIDFWRRWHMTLSRFLKDYLYIALGGNRKGRANRYRNLLVTMVLGGLWHGANWTFVAWGTLHGLYLVVNHFWRYLVRGRFDHSVFYRGSAWLITLFAVTNAWVMFRAQSWEQAMRFYKLMYFGESGTGIADSMLATDQLLPLLLGAFIAALAMPNTQEIVGLQRAETGGRLARVRWRPTPVWGGLLALLLVACALKLHSFSAFLYFQF